mmetsp:Transcript_21383/g.63925  ORF Transcript_21383/g.63925 Transcript_21383/m.63925 type:complete len:219 (-) Transcript_21383:116-772(-)
MEWPFRLRTHLMGYTVPSSSISPASMTSSTASPTSHSLTSMPAAAMPASVAALTVASSGSKRSSKATVHAQSMMRPSICVPKSMDMTSPGWMMVVSPPLGVKCAAMWLMEQPVGNPMPAWRPDSSTRSRFFCSMRSHISVSERPGLTKDCAYRRTCRCTSAAWRTLFHSSDCMRSRLRFSASVTRAAFWPRYSTTSPSGNPSAGKSLETGIEGGSVWP